MRRLEQRLRQGRPDARSAFVDELARQIEVSGRARSGRRLRLGLAAGLALALMALLASFGGYSYAASAITSTKDAISKVVSSAGPQQTALSSQNASQAAAKVIPAAGVYGLVSATCVQNGPHLNATVSGTSTDTNASDTITATFHPTGSGTAPGGATYSIHVNVPTAAPATSVTVTQLNDGTITVNCT